MSGEATNYYEVNYKMYPSCLILCSILESECVCLIHCTVSYYSKNYRLVKPEAMQLETILLHCLNVPIVHSH